MECTIYYFLDYFAIPVAVSLFGHFSASTWVFSLDQGVCQDLKRHSVIGAPYSK